MARVRVTVRSRVRDRVGVRGMGSVMREEVGSTW